MTPEAISIPLCATREPEMRRKLAFSHRNSRRERAKRCLEAVLAVLGLLALTACHSLGPAAVPEPASTLQAAGPTDVIESPTHVVQPTPSEPPVPPAAPTAGTAMIKPAAVISAENAARLEWLGTVDTQAASGGIRTMALSPNGSLLAIGDDNGVVQLLRVSDGTQLWAARANSDSVTDVAFMQGQDALVSASPWQAEVWGLEDGTLQASLDFPASGRQSPVVLGRTSADGRTLAMAIGSTVEIWDVAEAVQLGSVSTGWSHVWVMAFSPDGEYLAAYSIDANYQSAGVDVFRLEDGERLGSTLGAFTDMAFAQDGQSLYLAGGDGIRSWQVTQDVMGPPMDSGERADTWGMAFSPASELLAAGSTEGGVFIWNPRDGALLTELKGHTDAVTDVEFSLDGTLLASASDDGTIRLWGIR